jgi:hypothetical protein
MTNKKPISLEKRREEWQRKLVLHRNVPASVLKVALAIGWHFNRNKGGLAWPSTRSLSKLTNLALGTVAWAVKWLKVRGYLEVHAGNTGLSNRYLPLIPTSEASHVVEQGVQPRLNRVFNPDRTEPLNEPLTEPLILTASLASDVPKGSGIREGEKANTPSIESQCFQLARANYGERGAALVSKALDNSSGDEVLAGIQDAIESGEDIGYVLWRP